MTSGMFHKTLLFLVFVFLPMVNFALAQEATKPIENSTIATKENAPTDREIDNRIEEIFDEIIGLENVNSTVRSGVVTLRGTVDESSIAERASELAGRVDGVVAVENEIRENTAVSERLVPVIGRFEQRFQQAIDYLPLFTFAAFIWLLVSAIGWFLSSRQRPWSWIAPNAFIADLFRQIVFLAFLLLGLVIALDILGAAAVLGTILGAAGIIGLAIGFAVRDTVENYIASILLSIRQPFRPKDLINIDNYEGHVIRLTSRATILMDRDGNHIRIPNATVYKTNITNFTRNPERRFSFQLGIDADSDLHEALEKCLEILGKLEFVLDEPAPAAWINEVGDSNVVLEISGWVDQVQTDFLKARSEAIRLTKNALEQNGFALPEPIYRLRFDGNLPFAALADSTPTQAKSTSAKKHRKKSQEDIVVNADIGTDDTVLKKVEEERLQDSESDDLLNTHAADEMGPRADK